MSRPVLVDGEIVCITPASGVQSFNTRSRKWTERPSLLGAAQFVAVSLNRNLVVQTEDSIQIFSIGVLTSSEALHDVRLPHIYPLGENYILRVIQPHEQVPLLELGTLSEVRLHDNTLVFTESSSLHDLLSAWTERDEDVPLGGLSPELTWIVAVRGSPRRRLIIYNTRDGFGFEITLTRDELRGGEVHGVAFDSETRFYLKVAGPGWHAQIPYDIIPPLGRRPLTVHGPGEPEPLPKPWATPPYTLDGNCEWVLDADSRKICWIPPGNLRRGRGGHFWAGPSLVMVGDDGVVKKLTFKDPDC